MYTRNDIGYDNVTVNSVGGFALMSSKRIMCRDNTARDNVEFGILLNVCEGCMSRATWLKVCTTPKGKRRLIPRAKGFLSTAPEPAELKATLLRGLYRNRRGIGRREDDRDRERL